MTAKIPTLDLTRNYGRIKEEILEALNTVLEASTSYWGRTWPLLRRSARAISAAFRPSDAHPERTLFSWRSWLLI